MKNIMLAFIPIFFAVDAIGVLPLYVGFTQGISRQDQNRIIVQSIITALALAIGFVFLGKSVFHWLGISMGDFMIAGGSILFCIAITDIMAPGKRRRTPAKELGAVPLGTPLIVGPAVLTTSLIIISEYGLVPTLISIVTNVLLAGLIFLSSGFFMKVFGKNGAKAMSKITSLLIGAIAIMMVRKGIFFYINNN